MGPDSASYTLKIHFKCYIIYSLRCISTSGYASDPLDINKLKQNPCGFTNTISVDTLLSLTSTHTPLPQYMCGPFYVLVCICQYKKASEIGPTVGDCACWWKDTMVSLLNPIGWFTFSFILSCMSDVDCLVVNLDYVHCLWKGSASPAVNYTFYSKWVKP